MVIMLLYTKAEAIISLAFCLQLVPSLSVSKNNVVLRQYWKRQEASSGVNISSAKYWLNYLEKSLEITLNRTKTNMGLLRTMRRLTYFNMYGHLNCKLNVSSHRIIVLKICPIGKELLLPQKQIYMITVHKYVRVNLTVLEFHLSDAYRCIYENFNSLLYTRLNPRHWATIPTDVEHMGIVQYTKPGCNQNVTCIGQREFLCGHYPAHVHFLVYSSILLQYHVMPRLRSKLTISFQLMASDYAHYFKLTCFWFQCSEFGNIYNAYPVMPYTERILNLKLWNSYKFLSFRVITHRIYRLYVYKTRKNCDMVLDGPFFECQELDGKHYHDEKILFQSTSFQVLILLLLRNGSSLHQIEQHYKFTSINIGIDTIQTLQQISMFPKLIFFPWSSCSGKYVQFCVLTVPKPSLLSLNITVDSTQYTGPTILGSACTFGGLNVYFKDIGNKYMHEIINNCEGLTVGNRIKPSFITSQKTTHIWISTVSYFPYSTMNSSIMIAKTLCHGIYIKPIKATMQCQYPANELIYKSFWYSYDLSMPKKRLKINLKYTSSNFYMD